MSVVLKGKDDVVKRPETSVEFTNIEYTIGKGGWKNETKAVLIKNLSGKFDAGKLTAIIGPSGCGKTTLMNIIAGRVSKSSVKNSTLTGEISLSGTIVNPVRERNQFAYVIADEAALQAQLSPLEAIQFSAEMRLPEFTPEQRQKRVDDIISELGLDKCSQTWIGSDLVKGISSGEKKRTSVGVELVRGPGCCFLDEPTTGLDSFSAYQLCQSLKDISSTGCCVVSVIHQPSSEVFSLFDDVLFLVKGAIVYHGPVKGVRKYIADAGHPCAANYNPADHVMTLMQTLPQDELQGLVDRWKAHKMDADEAAIHAMRTEKGKSEGKGVLPEIKRAGMGKQFKELFAREMKVTVRDKKFLGMRFIGPILLNTLIGGILWQVGGQLIDQAHIAAVTGLAISAMMNTAQPLILTFPLERPVFMREYTAGMYAASPYFISKMVIELIFGVIAIAVTTCIGYFMTGLVGNFGMIYLGAILLSTASSSLAVLVGCVCATPRKAIEAMPLVFMPQMLFAGLWIRIDQIPVWLRWMQYIMPMKYSVDIMYIGEFTGLPGYEVLFNTNDVDSSLLWMYILVVCAIIAGARFAGFFALKLSARTTVF